MNIKQTIQDGLKRKKILSKRDIKINKYLGIIGSIAAILACTMLLVVLPAVIQCFIDFLSIYSLILLCCITLPLILAGIHTINLLKELGRQLNITITPPQILIYFVYYFVFSMLMIGLQLGSVQTAVLLVLTGMITFVFVYKARMKIEIKGSDV